MREIRLYAELSLFGLWCGLKPYAVSVSAMLLTTEDAVIDIKEENPVGGMPGIM